MTTRDAEPASKPRRRGGRAADETPVPPRDAVAEQDWDDRIWHPIDGERRPW